MRQQIYSRRLLKLTTYYMMTKKEKDMIWEDTKQLMDKEVMDMDSLVDLIFQIYFLKWEVEEVEVKEELKDSEETIL